MTCFDLEESARSKRSSFGRINQHRASLQGNQKKPPPVPVKTAVLNPRVQGGAARSGLCEPRDAETSRGYTRSQTELTPYEIIIVGSTHWSRIEHCRGSKDSEEPGIDASVRNGDMQEATSDREARRTFSGSVPRHGFELLADFGKVYSDPWFLLTSCTN